MDFSFTVFWKAIDDELKEGRRLVDKIETIALYQDNQQNDEQQFTNEILATLISRLHQRILLTCDYFHLQSFLAHFQLTWASFKNPIHLKYNSYAGVLYCPALEYLADAFESLAAIYPRPEGSIAVSFERMGILEQILRGTPKIIRDRQLSPSTEAEIRNAVYDTLIHVFPETVREVPIAQVSKAYKPDIGIRSLKAAVEYKFADSEEETRKLLGQIYEDIHGYAGSSDWINFFAVLYMTDAFLTQAQVDAEWQMTNVPHSWKPILVTGRGARAVRKQPRRAAKK